jgi:DNA-directed RNA polymerase specialized sigma24 family protein
MASGKRERLWRSIVTRSIAAPAGAPSDLELLDRWRAGERTAGEELCRRHLDSLRGFFATKCRRDADELARRTLLASAVDEDPHPGGARSAFRTYLFTLARRELYRHLEQRRGAGVDFSITSIAELMAPGRGDEGS